MENPTVLYNKATGALVSGADIRSGVDYTAISHTWSMWDSASKEILGIEHDPQSKGTTNFRAMVEFVVTEWIWLDTLCITESTKVTEIPNMRRYYRNAAVVLVVLDVAKGEYDLGALEGRQLGERMDSHERIFMLGSAVPLSDQGVTIYDTLCTMFRAEYFKRGWTLQELLLAREVVIWNGSTSVGVADVRRCLDWLGSVLPDVVNGLEEDEGFATMQSLFQADCNEVAFEDVDALMDGRRCTKHEDYVYCILGLLDVEMKIEYGVSLDVCKRRLFARLVEEGRGASLLSHSGVGVFPVCSDYGTSLISDTPRSDRAVFSMVGDGVRFADCAVYVYEVLGRFPRELVEEDPTDTVMGVTKVIGGENKSGYKDLVRAMYCLTAGDDVEPVVSKSQWFLDMATGESSDEDPANLDCFRLHSLLSRTDTPWVSYGLVHNNVSVCAYIFTCLEEVPEDDQCVLLAPGIVGALHETGILCSASKNPNGSTYQKIGATLNLRKDTLSDIEPLDYWSDVVVTDMHPRNPSP